MYALGWQKQPADHDPSVDMEKIITPLSNEQISVLVSSLILATDHSWRCRHKP